MPTLDKLTTLSVSTHLLSEIIRDFADEFDSHLYRGLYERKKRISSQAGREQFQLDLLFVASHITASAQNSAEYFPKCSNQLNRK